MIRQLYGRTIALALAMVAGLLVPQAHNLSSLIPYLLVVMLFFSFLDMTISRSSFNKGVVWVLLANLTIAFLAYFLLRFVDLDLALVAFMTGITPTATAAPVIIGFLDGSVQYVVTSVLITNMSMALVLPFVLPLIVGTHLEISTWAVLQSVLLVVFVPLQLAWIFSYLPRKTQTFIRKGKPYSFYIWLFALFLITSKSTYFILNDLSVSGMMLLKIALISLVICIINFGVGGLLGGEHYKREASQSLGQKNNSFSIWLALTFISPIVALGPTFYIVYHNLYNSFQLYVFEKTRLKKHESRS